MMQLGKDLVVAQTIILMNSYSFDLHGSTAEELVAKWLTTYHATWIRLATIEALYLGRYKAISIEQIMTMWSRLGNPKVHFGGEFERLICRKLPRHLVVNKDSEQVAQQHNTEPEALDYPVDSAKILPKKPEIPAENPLSPSYDLLNSEESPNHLKSLEQNHNSFSQSQNDSSASSVSSEPPQTQKSTSPPSDTKSDKTNPSKTIDRFNPIPDMSSLFQKLKTIAKTNKH
ncbi:MAG: hypothetical protein QNJ32_31010 [Xenococcaceae cyanobacterium MO_167.B27]|nr:hypothetical protein [Xenococcaceae cyanobacterium MO_167.B27]